MEVICDYGLPIKAECGGACACATCHVDTDWMDKQDEAFAMQENSRLSCQILMSPKLSGLSLTLAPGSKPD